MRSEFQIIDTFGYVISDVMIEMPVGSTLDEATAEARDQFEADVRNAYDSCANHVPGERCTERCEQHKADSVLASIAEIRWSMPNSYAA